MSDGLRDAIAKCCVTAIRGGAIPMEDLGAFAQNLDETVRAWLSSREPSPEEIEAAAAELSMTPWALLPDDYRPMYRKRAEAALRAARSVGVSDLSPNPEKDATSSDVPRIDG